MRRPTSKPPVTRLRSPSRSSTYKTSSKQNNGAAALEDERFKQFLKNADEIESIEHFMYWKDEFFTTFRPYLDPLGTATAREADEELYFELEKLANACVHTNELVKEGKISPEKSSVKGQKSINEMIASTCTCEQHIDRYFPKTQEEELTCGYSKFELAAVLVRDGFRVYGMMVATRNYVQGLVIEGGALQKILKSNQMSILQYYFRCLDTFAQTMADLGMFKLMVRCEELYSVRPRRKKNKTKKFNKHGAKDALSDTSCEGEAINGGRMFQKSKLNYRAIMDKGWSNGLCLGQEILGPLKFSKKNDKKKKKGGKKKKRLIKENNKDANCKSGEDNEVASNDETNFSPEAGSSSSIEDDSVDETAETVDELMSMASSSEDEEEDEEDVIYYFDPVRKIVGKVSRKKCLAEITIVSVDSETGTERAEGVVEEWDSRDDEIGKQDLILNLKEILFLLISLCRGIASKTPRSSTLSLSSSAANHHHHPHTMARKPREIPKRARATKAASKPAKKSLSKKRAATTTGFKNPREVSDAVYRFMCEEHAYGVTEWTRAELASAVGFGNPKTEKFAKGLKNLVSHEGLAESGATGGTLVLSALGIARKPTEKTPATLGDLHNRFLERLAQKCKGGTDKLPAVWDILKDRKEHSIASVAQKLGYKNPKSFGNTKIIATMRAMGLVENGSGRGTVQMTEKAFPSNLCN